MGGPAAALVVLAFFVTLGGGLLWVTAKELTAYPDPATVLLMTLGGSVQGIGLLIAVIAGRLLQADEQNQIELEEEGRDGQED